MSSSYQLKVNDTFHFECDAVSANALDVVATTDNQFHILSENKR